MTKIFR